MLKFIKLIKNNAIANSGVRAFTIANSAAPATNTDNEPAVVDPDAPIEMENPYQKEKLQCILCKNRISPSYKNVKLLSQFQSAYTGRIYGRHITGLCKQKQEEVEKAIIRAQNCALMPSYHKDTDFLQDPKLFNPYEGIKDKYPSYIELSLQLFWL